MPLLCCLQFDRVERKDFALFLHIIYTPATKLWINLAKWASPDNQGSCMKVFRNNAIRLRKMIACNAATGRVFYLARSFRS